MIHSLKYGLSVVYRKPLLVILVFLYEMFWGFLLYRYIRSVIAPLLYRYPGAEVPSWSSLFWIEGEFRLLKTDLAYSTTLTLLAILVARMLFTPLLNAGIYYAIHHISSEQWKTFWSGIRMRWGRFLILYLLQMAITLLPLYWLVPPVIRSFQEGTLHVVHLTEGILVIAAYLLYLSLVRLCFMYLQFAAACGERWSAALAIWSKKLLPLIGLSASILLISLILQAILASASMFWAGLAALIIYQATPLLRVSFQMWEIASQHDLWLRSRNSPS